MMTPAEDAKAMALFNSGHPLREIARRLRVSHETVRSALKRQGLEMRLRSWKSANPFVRSA